MNRFDKPLVAISFADCSPDMKRNVLTVFRGMGTECTKLILRNARPYPFPVKAVDEYLRKHPEKVRKVTELHLDFSDPINDRHSVQLLEMVRKRFPNIRWLNVPKAFTHPIGHVLEQYAQMPNLRTIHFRYSVHQLAEYAKTNDLITLPQVKSLFYCMVGNVDTYEDFEVTLPIIFPNLESLHYLGPGDEFADQIYANAKRFFPRMKLCKVVDSSEISAIVHENGPPQYPIDVSERLN